MSASVGERASLLFLLTLTSCAALQPIPLPPEAEIHRAKTDDGWEISLTRYRAIGESKGPPVVLCHGISANERNMDLDDRHSMARWFASQGREAWTMSLRGTGKSDTIDASKNRPGPIYFDDYWKHDLPAVVGYVRQVSGAPAIDYAGHSMGGMVLYAYLSQGGQGIHAAATLGTPTRLDWGTGMEGLIKTAGPALVQPGWMIPSGAGALLASPFQGVVDDGPFQRFFYNPQSTDLETWRRLMVYGTASVAGGTALQLIELMSTGRFQSADGKIDLRADMAKITTPVIVVAGRLDRIAVAPAVKDGYRALGGPKEWLVITRANGAKGEYGHMDLVIGERAAGEVWSKILAFFQRAPSPRGGEGRGEGKPTDIRRRDQRSDSSQSGITPAPPPEQPQDVPNTSMSVPASFGSPALPASDGPASGSPASGSPASGSPASGSPASGSPASGSPASGSPASGSPASG